MPKLDPGSADGSEGNPAIIADTGPHTPLAVENDKVDLKLPAATLKHLKETLFTRYSSLLRALLTHMYLQSARFLRSSPTAVLDHSATAVRRKYSSFD